MSRSAWKPIARRNEPANPIRRRLAPAVLAASLALGACGSSSAGDVIERDTFIDAYVELRIAALETDSSRIAADDRQAILDRLGITEDDLLGFVEVHGSDLELMREVWNEVELRMDRTPDVAEEQR